METIHRLPVDALLLGQQESATEMMFKDIHFFEGQRVINMLSSNKSAHG